MPEPHCPAKASPYWLLQASFFGARAAANPQQMNITFPTPSLVMTRVGHGLMLHCGSSRFILYSLMRQGRALFYRRIPVPCSVLQSNMCCRDLLFTKLKDNLASGFGIGTVSCRAVTAVLL